MTVKLVCVVHDALPTAAPNVPGLRGFALHLPAPGEAPEHPNDVAGIAMAWLDDGAALDPGDWFGGAPVTAYRVDERVRIDYERDWPDGTPSPGPRRISFVQRAPGITRAAMADHWGDVHSPLALVHHPAIWRYVQNVVVEPVTLGAPEVDGIAELHFRSATDLHERFYDSEDGRRIIGEDVRRFLAPSRGWRMVAQETWVRSPWTEPS